MPLQSLYLAFLFPTTAVVALLSLMYRDIWQYICWIEGRGRQGIETRTDRTTYMQTHVFFIVYTHITRECLSRFRQCIRVHVRIDVQSKLVPGHIVSIVNPIWESLMWDPFPFLLYLSTTSTEVGFSKTWEKAFFQLILITLAFAELEVCRLTTEPQHDQLVSSTKREK